MLEELIINDASQIVTRYKPDVSIALLREFEPMALALHPDGYYLTYSGGKDSDTDLQIAIESGVKFTVHYNITGIDPKEAVIHIKETRQRIALLGIHLYMHSPERFTTGPYKGLQKNMWRLIVHKMMPPTRICRYCCDHLKERGGIGRLCITGVRWDESTQRKGRKPLEIVTPKRRDKKLFNDNDEGRLQFENCMQKGKRVINPIIGWTTEDIWEFLKDRKVPYCKLYDCGVQRIGCTGCPTIGAAGQEEGFERYPYVKELYLNAFKLMLEYMWSRGIETSWKNEHEVFEWWLYAADKEQKKVIEGQIEMMEWLGLIDETELGYELG